MKYFLRNIYNIQKLLTVIEKYLNVTSFGERDIFRKPVRLNFYIRNIKKTSSSNDFPKYILGGWSWNHCCSI